MRIFNLETRNKDRSIVLSADVVFDGKKPERIWFEIEDIRVETPAIDYTPFLACVLLPCLKLGENIYIEGNVSEKFLEKTKKLMDLVVGWKVGFRKITIETAPSQLLSEKSTSLKGVGTFFSGGVDSFYTYLKHKKEITDLILIHGFDIPLKNKILSEETKKQIAKIAEKENLKFIIVKTNAKDILEKYLIWDFTHGGVLAAVGLLFENNLKKIFIPGSVRKDELFPYGTHPLLDPLWSTEKINFIHDGTEYNRLGKIINSISKSNLALSNLRVCTKNIKGKYNCSECYKCLQTMIELIVAGIFEKANTFEHPLDLKKVKNMYYDYSLHYNDQGEENLKILREQNRKPELQKAIEESLKKSREFSMIRTVSKIFSQFDQKYMDRKFYRFVFGISNNQDRNFVFKFLMKIGFLK